LMNNRDTLILTRKINISKENVFYIQIILL